MIFLSKCFGGRANNRFITKTSDYMLLNANDEVMTDWGFTIGEELFSL